MYSNGVTKKEFREAFSATGIKTRSFTIDYRDDFNNYYHIQADTAASPGASDNQIAASLIQEVEAKGFTVFCIGERLNGYSIEDIEIIAKRSLSEASKYMKPLYFDPSKERA